MMEEEQYYEPTQEDILEAQVAKRAAMGDPTGDPSLPAELFDKAHNYTPQNVPALTKDMWGVFSGIHPAMSYLNEREVDKLKSFIRNHRRLILASIPRRKKNNNIINLVEQGEALGYMQTSKGRDGREAQTSRAAMVGIVQNYQRYGAQAQSLYQKVKKTLPWGGNK